MKSNVEVYVYTGDPNKRDFPSHVTVGSLYFEYSNYSDSAVLKNLWVKTDKRWERTEISLPKTQLTGQEFYDRFEDEFLATKKPTISDEDREAVLDAARKASGIK